MAAGLSLLCALLAVATALPAPTADARRGGVIRRLPAVAGAGSPLGFELNASRGDRPAKAQRADRSPTLPSAPARPTLRMIAEFEEMDGVLIRFPLGLSLELVTEFSMHSRVYCLCVLELEIIARDLFADAGVDLEQVIFVPISTDSYWTRDFGPWWTETLDGRDAEETAIGGFVYDRPRPNDNLVSSALAEFFGVGYTTSELALSGGNMMADSQGFAAATDLIYEYNNDFTREEIDAEFEAVWGVEMRAHPDPTGTYIEHMCVVTVTPNSLHDCWAKFLDSSTILVSRVPEEHPLYEDYEAAAEFFAEFYTLVRVDVGMATNPYTNSLIVNGRVYVPVGNDPELDDMALETYAAAMPDAVDVIGVEAAVTAPWVSTDALHCRTKGIPAAVGTALRTAAGVPAQTNRTSLHN